MGDGFTDITGSTLEVDVRFPDSNQNWVELGIPSSFLSAQGQQLLATPLSEQFRTFWAVTQDSNGQTQRDRATAMAKSQVVAAVQSNTGQTAYGISANFPAAGNLLASVTGNLVLHYTLPNVVITFNTTTSTIFGSYADPAFKLTFDLTLEIASPVPAMPCSFTPQAAMIIENANIGGDNFIGDAVQFIGDLVNFFQGEPPIFQAAEGNIDGINPVGTGSLGNTFALLAGACAQAQQAGFVQFQADVDQSVPALQFVLIHPLDAAPAFNDQTFPSLFHPIIGVSQLTIIAGDTLGVFGSSFTPPATTSLVLQWNDTISGTIVKSEIEWGPQGGPTTIVSIPRHPYDGANGYQFSNLAPNQTYQFRVRDWDATTCTPWSTWMTVSTPNSNAGQVLIYLDQDYTNPLASVPLQSDGTFTATVTIPGTTTPVPHAHLINAQLMGGDAAPPVQIEILAPGSSYSPTIEMIDPSNSDQPTSSAEELTPFTVRAYGFAPGTLNFTIDSVTGNSVGQGTVQPDSKLPATPFTMPAGVIGSHRLFGWQVHGGTTVYATWTFFSQELPR